MTDKPSDQTTDTALLNWLEKHPQCEVSYEGWDDDPPWRVCRVHGGRNDREWTEVGRGETLRDALRAAQEGMKRHGR